MKQRFYSKKDPWIRLLIFVVALLPFIITIPLFYIPQSKPTPAPVIIGLYTITISASLLMLSFWFQTYYEIDDEYVYYRMGPFKGKIPIKSIRSVKKHAARSFYSPSLSYDLVLITYNVYDDISLSPQDQDGFVVALRIMNKNIVIE
jgi:hypothetical protein